MTESAVTIVPGAGVNVRRRAVAPGAQAETTMPTAAYQPAHRDRIGLPNGSRLSCGALKKE